MAGNSNLEIQPREFMEPVEPNFKYQPDDGPKFNYVWTINNFSSRQEKTGEVLESPKFTDGESNEFKWCLRIYPNGEDQESKDYVSLYLYLDIVGLAKAIYKFSILNAKGEKIYTQESPWHCFNQNCYWGHKKFMKRELLFHEGNGLLVNDNLTISCDIIMDGPYLSFGKRERLKSEDEERESGFGFLDCAEYIGWTMVFSSVGFGVYMLIKYM